MISQIFRSKMVQIFFLFTLALFSVAVFAADQTTQGQQRPYIYGLSDTVTRVTPQSMIQNIATQIPNLMNMVTAIAYVMGMYFVVLGVMRLKQYGEARSMMSQEHSLKGPLIFIAIGALLIYLPTTVHVGLSTFWTNPAPYGYKVTEKDQWVEFINMCFLIVQLVGTIAFIRGLVILTQLGGHAQPGTFGRGLTHIIGGIFCINIYQFVQVILITLGVQT